MQVNPYGLAMMVPAAIMLVLVALIVNRSRSPMVLSFLGLVVSGFIYSLCYSFELMSLSLDQILYWIRWEYVGISFIPAFWLFFTISAINRSEWLTPSRIVMFLGFSTICLVGVLTNSFHHLHYRETWLNQDAPILLLAFQRGPIYWLVATYMSASIIVGNILFVREYQKTSGIARKRAWICMISSFIPWVSHLIYLLGLTPWHIDSGSLFLTFSGLGFMFGILRYNLFNVLPIANATVFRGMTLGVVVLDPQGIILESNPAARQYTGIVEKNVGTSWLDISTPEMKSIHEALNGNRSHAEVALDSPVGLFYLDIALTVLLDKRKQPVGRLLTLRDITLRKRTEEERLEMQKRLLSANKAESLGIMAGGIAHDYNNMFQVVLGNLDLVSHQANGSNSVSRYLDRASEALRKAADLTHQILAFSGRGRYQLEEFDLNAHIREVAGTITEDLPVMISLELYLDENLPILKGDPIQLHYVVANLLKNAVEAVGERSGQIIVRTSRGFYNRDVLERSRIPDKPAEGEFLVLDVSDTGGGMSPEVQDRAFDPFYSTKGIGRGVGLSALHGIMRTQKGAILLESTPGQGTQIQVLFPLTITPQGNLELGIRETGTFAVATGEKILLVDDEDPVREVGVHMLESIGYQVISAPDGQTAVECIAKHGDEIRLVVLDLLMPGMDGSVTFREIRKLNPGQKIILCSGYSEQMATHGFGGLGLNGFLQKPYSMNQIESAIHKVLDE